MRHLICRGRTLWLSMPQWLGGRPGIEGHPYYETYTNKDVQILKCMRCEQYCVGYFNGGEPKPYDN